MKVVLNRRFGGFGLSQKALEGLRDQGWTVSNFLEDHSPIDKKADLLLKPKGTKFGYVDEGKLYINWWKHKESALVIEIVDDEYNWEVTSFDGMEKIKYGSLKEDC